MYDITEIKNLIEEADNKIKFKTETILEKLKEIEKDINSKYDEAIKLWKKSVKLYSDFIAKNPGSKQVNPPSSKPERPSQTDIVKGYIAFFESLEESEILIDARFINNAIRESLTGLTETRKLRDVYACAVSGLVVTGKGW